MPDLRMGWNFEVPPEVPAAGLQAGLQMELQNSDPGSEMLEIMIASTYCTQESIVFCFYMFLFSFSC